MICHEVTDAHKETELRARNSALLLILDSDPRYLLNHETQIKFEATQRPTLAPYCHDRLLN